VSAASITVMSIADNTLRSVGSEGGRAHTVSACGAVDAHWAIATQVVAPAIAACSASSRIARRP
jgi:hypothetical protein